MCINSYNFDRQTDRQTFCTVKIDTDHERSTDVVFPGPYLCFFV